MTATNQFERSLVGQDLDENEPTFVGSCTTADDGTPVWMEKDVVLTVYRIDGEKCAAINGALPTGEHAALALKLSRANGATLTAVYHYDGHAPEALDLLRREGEIR